MIARTQRVILSRLVTVATGGMITLAVVTGCVVKQGVMLGHVVIHVPAKSAMSDLSVKQFGYEHLVVHDLTAFYRQ